MKSFAFWYNRISQAWKEREMKCPECKVFESVDGGLCEVCADFWKPMLGVPGIEYFLKPKEGVSDGMQGSDQGVGGHTDSRDLVEPADLGVQSVSEVVRDAFIDLAPKMVKHGLLGAELVFGVDISGPIMVGGNLAKSSEEESQWPGFDAYTSCTREELIAKMREEMKTYVCTPPPIDDDPVCVGFDRGNSKDETTMSLVDTETGLVESNVLIGPILTKTPDELVVTEQRKAWLTFTLPIDDGRDFFVGLAESDGSPDHIIVKE